MADMPDHPAGPKISRPQLHQELGRSQKEKVSLMRWGQSIILLILVSHGLVQLLILVSPGLVQNDLSSYFLMSTYDGPMASLPVSDRSSSNTTFDSVPSGGENIRLQEQGRRLCSSQEIRHGAWVPVTLDRPPYIPQKSKCYDNEFLQKATIWPTYQWHPTAFSLGQCDFEQWNAEDFCRLADGKTVGLMGDSLTWEQFASLVGLLGRQVGAHDQLTSKMDNGTTYSQQEPFLMDVCQGKTQIGFYRHRYLLYPEKFLNITQPDIMVFNRGAHVPTYNEIEFGYGHKPGQSGMISLIQNLKDYHARCRMQGRKCLTLWRTTAPGAPFCKNFTEPAKSVEEMERYIAYDPEKYPGKSTSYRWWMFKPMNEFILSLFANATNGKDAFPFDVIPGYDLNILRPDSHVSERDCLHNCDPGAPDVYNTVLLHLMRLHLQTSGQSGKS